MIIKGKLKKMDEEIEERKNKINRLEDFLLRGNTVMQGVNIKDELNKEKEEVKTLSQKREEFKKQIEFREAGSIAFKCNWNDNNYKGICSRKAYEFNQEAKHVWCIQKENECHDFIKKNIKAFPCYESRLLLDFKFNAGIHHTGPRKGKPMAIRKVRKGKVAFLTTREPEMKEEDRYIFGIFDIDKINDERYKNKQERETTVFGNKKTSIIINNKIKLNFWDFYKNKDKSKFWGSGLHRYISDKEVLQILSALRNEYEKLNLDGEEIKKINNLVSRFQNFIYDA